VSFLWCMFLIQLSPSSNYKEAILLIIISNLVRLFYFSAYVSYSFSGQFFKVVLFLTLLSFNITDKFIVVCIVCILNNNLEVTNIFHCTRDGKNRYWYSLLFCHRNYQRLYFLGGNRICLFTWLYFFSSKIDFLYFSSCNISKFAIFW